MENPNVEKPSNAEILPEKVRRKSLFKAFVERKILGLDPVLDMDEEEVSYDDFSDLPELERVGLLYEKIMAWSSIPKEKLKNREDEEVGSGSAIDPDPYLVSEIRALWSDESTRDLFLEKYAQTRIDAKTYRLSDLGNSWDDLNLAIDVLKKQHAGLARQLFLQQLAGKDRVSSAQSRTARIARQLIEKRQLREDLFTLEGVPEVQENTDVVAGIQYDKLRSYQEQAKAGFVWLPSREDIYHKTTNAMQNGRWPVLIGEAGTGKSELADAAALALTGELPTHVPCGPRTGEKDLISDPAIAQSGESYDQYKPLLAAAIGFDDSLQSAPTCPHGRVVRFDEINRLDQSGQAYSLLKEARQWRRGSMVHGKEVLPGFSAIGTANPPGPRYPDRAELDAAMRREVAEIEVDYPPQANDNPETYEFMLALLLEDDGHINVARHELAPAYRLLDLPEKQTIEGMPDVVADSQEVLIDDPTNKEHGFLWRLSFAIRALQNSFLAGNSQGTPANVLRYNVDSSGVIKIDDNGEPLTLRTSTNTLGEIASWLKGFKERRQKDDANFQTDSLSEWINYKLDLYIESAEAVDQPKLRAIFDYYHLGDASKEGNSQILTFKEIGYLSPRVPRPINLKETIQEEVMEEGERTSIPDSQVEHELNNTVQLMLEDGSEVLVRPISMEIPHPDKNIQLVPNCRFKLKGQPVSFAGFVEDPSRPDDATKLVIRLSADDPDSNLHKIVTEIEIAEDGDDFWPFTSEEMSFEKLKQSYDQQIDILRRSGILESLPSGFEGIVGVDSKEYRVPSFENVVERVLASQEMLVSKSEQGFTELLLVPLACPIGKKLPESGGRYEYTGLLKSYVELMRKKAEANPRNIDGKHQLKAEKKSPDDPDQWIVFDEKDPLYVWDTLMEADTLKREASNPLRYYPDELTGSSGKTKDQLLVEYAGSNINGFEILFTQDLSVIPRAGEGQAIGNRPPIESSGDNQFIPMDSNETVPSIREYHQALQNPAPESPYKDESGLTIEAWLTLAIHKLEQTGEVLDDYQGLGRISYLLGNFIDGRVPGADFGRGSQESGLGGRDPEDRDGNCGVRSVVRVP